ncbi:MAG: hypothetical protein QOF29_2293 [bacterium]
MQSVTRRPRPASASGCVIPSRGVPAHVAVTVVAEDRRFLARVTSALRREGVAAHVEAGGTTSLQQDAIERRPDVVLLACADAKARLAEAARVRRLFPNAHVVAAIEHTRTVNVRWLLEAGVDGVVLEHDLDSTIGFVVRAVCAGHVSLPRAMRHAVAPPALSEREREILALVVAGLSNAEIADRQYLSRSTVASRLTGIFRQLGVQSRSEAVALVAGDEALRDSVAAVQPPPLRTHHPRGRR